MTKQQKARRALSRMAAFFLAAWIVVWIAWPSNRDLLFGLATALNIYIAAGYVVDALDDEVA